jgi:signal transduction histidine kinase
LSFNLQSSLKKQEISAGELCRIIEAEYRDELENLGVQFTVSTDSSPHTLCIDISKIRRVFGNIISDRWIPT